MRPPVIDGIEELAQDSELGRVQKTEELDFLDARPDDREPPVSTPDTSRNDRTQAP